MIVPDGNTGLVRTSRWPTAAGTGAFGGGGGGRSRPAARTASGDRIRLSAGARTSRTDRRITRHTKRYSRTTNAIRATRSACSTTLGPGLLERQRDGAEGNVIAGEHRRLADALAVDRAAVRGVEVAEQEAVAVADELGVAARDAAVLEHDVALARAAEHDGAAVEHLAAAGPGERVLLPREVGGARLPGRDEGGLAGGRRLLVEVGLGVAGRLVGDRHRRHGRHRRDGDG